MVNKVRAADRAMVETLEAETDMSGLRPMTEARSRNRLLFLRIIFYPMFALWTLLVVGSGSGLGASGSNGRRGQDGRDFDGLE